MPFQPSLFWYFSQQPPSLASNTSGHRSRFHRAKPCTEGTAMGGSAAAEGGAGAGGALRGVSETSEISSSESWSGSLAEDSFFGGETSGNIQKYWNLCQI